MYHLVDNLQTKAGDALGGYYVKLKDADGNYATLYSDANSTPIATVSGVADTAVTDATTGQYDLYVADGDYTICFFDKNDINTLVQSIASVPMHSFGVASDITTTGDSDVQTDLDARVTTADLASTATGKGATLVGYAEAGTGAVDRTVLDRLRETVNLLDYIPTNLHADILAGTSTTDVSSYLNAGFAYAETLVAPYVILPRGAYFTGTTTISFYPPDYTVFEQVGLIRSAVASAVPALRIGTTGTTSSDRTLFATIRGVKVQRSLTGNFPFTSADMTAGGVTTGSVGLELINLGLSNIDVRRVDGFTYGVKLNGTSGGSGFAQNTVSLGYIVDNKFNVYLTASGSGWCNENIFIGPNDCKWSADFPNFTGCYGIFLDDAVALVNMNNNKFIGPSLQSHSTSTRAAQIAGTHNVIWMPRYENAADQTTEAFVFTASSQRCAILGRTFQLLLSNINDAGQENEYDTIEMQRLFRATPAGEPLLSLRSNVSNSARLWEGKTVAGSMTSYAEAGGRLFTTASLYADAGIRWSTSSGSLDDRGIFVGTGSPEGVQTARVGSLFVRTDGGASTVLYVKESGTGSTGWVAK